jgi:hypothetical protein
MSMSASGQVGKTLVYANWKGLKYARQYVTPANPNTGPQQTQRGYLTQALAFWHSTTVPIMPLDTTNLSRAAGYATNPLSGFNLYVQNYIKSRVAGATPNQLNQTAEASLVTGAASIEAHSVASVTTVKLRWGFSPTAMLNLVVRTEAGAAGTTHTFDITAVTTGQVIYYQVYDLVAGSSVNLGIGRATIVAA